MDKVSDLIGKVLSRRGLVDHATAALITHKASKWIAERIPSADAYTVTTLKDGVLCIETDHAEAAQELSRKKEDLLEHFATEHPGTVTSIAINS